MIQKNHRITELKDKQCKVIKNTLRDSIMPNTIPQDRATKEVTMPGGITVSFTHYNKNNLHPLYLGSFPNKVNCFHLYLHATPHPRQSGNRAEDLLWLTSHPH